MRYLYILETATEKPNTPTVWGINLEVIIWLGIFILSIILLTCYLITTKKVSKRSENEIIVSRFEELKKGMLDRLEKDKSSNQFMTKKRVSEEIFRINGFIDDLNVKLNDTDNPIYAQLIDSLNVIKEQYAKIGGSSNEQKRTALENEITTRIDECISAIKGFDLLIKK